MVFSLALSQLALGSFFEDGADDDIVALPHPEGGSSMSRSIAPRLSFIVIYGVHTIDWALV